MPEVIAQMMITDLKIFAKEIPMSISMALYCLIFAASDYVTQITIKHSALSKTSCH